MNSRITTVVFSYHVLINLIATILFWAFSTENMLIIENYDK